jgi:hypothetical protein
MVPTMNSSLRQDKQSVAVNLHYEMVLGTKSIVIQP